MGAQYKQEQRELYFANDVTLPYVEPLMASSANEQWSQRYVYGAQNERISMSYKASGDASNDREPTSGASRANASAAYTSLYYLADVRGSVIGLTNDAGTISARYHYDEFGSMKDSYKLDLNYAGPDNLFGYTGLAYDYASDLSYARARYFNSGVGRFISEDTYEGELTNPLSMNLYTYVHNNPLRYIDPSGHKIVITGTQEFVKQTFNDLQQLTIMELQIDKDGVVTQVMAACPPTNHVGSNLVMELIDHKKTVTINELTEQNGYATPLNGKKASNGKGSDVLVEYNPNFYFKTLSLDSITGERSDFTVDPFIVLGHELVHSYHMVNGTRVKPSVFADYTYIDSNGQTQTKNWRVEELITVGLGNSIVGKSKYKKDYFYTENNIRAEHNFPLRVYY